MAVRSTYLTTGHQLIYDLMRKTFISILSVLAAVILPAGAQERLSERVYVSTDRDVYVAGDELFFSAFCLDMTDGGFSSASNTAYIEIVSDEGPVQTSKVALEDGRGGGVISLQNTIPTGNYRLVAYTAQCFNEEGYNFLEGARTISIINPFTTARSASGVEILSDEDYLSVQDGNPHPAAGGVRLDASGPLRITNTSDKAVTLSLSVFNDDGIPSPATVNPVSFRAGATSGRNFNDNRPMDYEGEIIRTRLVGSADDVASANGGIAYLSVPGRITDLYSSIIEPDGTATFYTKNIYGRTNLVLDAGKTALDAHLEIVSPFEGVKDPEIPALPMSSSMQDRILQRSLSMQVQRAANSDSLYMVLPHPEEPLFCSDSVVYILDDYTRFPLMEELFIEYINEIGFRRSPQNKALYVALKDDFRLIGLTQLTCLALIDGVPVSDHNLIFDYDPLLVEKIVIYPNSYLIGSRTYPGVINFVTYRGDLPSYPFPDNTRVVDFQGVSYPVVSWLPDTSGEIPDLRQTILWHPLIELAPGETRTLEYVLPSYQGNFKVVVEGFDTSGAPQSASGAITSK